MQLPAPGLQCCQTWCYAKQILSFTFGELRGTLRPQSLKVGTTLTLCSDLELPCGVDESNDFNPPPSRALRACRCLCQNFHANIFNVIKKKKIEIEFGGLYKFWKSIVYNFTVIALPDLYAWVIPGYKCHHAVILYPCTPLDK